MLNEEGGIDPLEFRFYAMTDRVATTGTVWLGLTLGCAQCHTHKFDPIPHREYYQLMAFLNNADEPEMDVPHAGDRRAGAHANVEAKIDALPSCVARTRLPATRNCESSSSTTGWSRSGPQRCRGRVLRPARRRRTCRC